MVVFVDCIAKGKGKKRRPYIGLNGVGYVTQSKVADPQGEESNDDDGEPGGCEGRKPRLIHNGPSATVN